MVVVGRKNSDLLLSAGRTELSAQVDPDSGPGAGDDVFERLVDVGLSECQRSKLFYHLYIQKIYHDYSGPDPKSDDKVSSNDSGMSLGRFWSMVGSDDLGYSGWSVTRFDRV